MHSAVSIMIALLVVFANAAKADEPVTSREQLNAVLWFQQSAEYKANATIMYGLATQQLKKLRRAAKSASVEQSADKTSFRRKSRAVVVDIDETILDNSPFNAALVKNGKTYSSQGWLDWVQAAQAQPIQGAVGLGFRVLFVTNRECAPTGPFNDRGESVSCPQEEATHKNLAAVLGYMPEDADVYFRFERQDRVDEDKIDKQQRRKEIAEQFRIAMLVGDDLNDFVRGADYDLANHGSHWGHDWFVLTNPMYGSWEAKRSLSEKYAALNTWTKPANALTAMGHLRRAFRRHYDTAVAAHEDQLRSKFPLITQDLLNMTLWLPDGRSSEFSMKTDTYMLMASISHPPLAVYSSLSAAGFGPLPETTRTELATYSRTLDAATADIQSQTLDEATKRRLVTILNQTKAFVDTGVTRGSVTREEFVDYVKPLRALLRENLQVGAMEQLVQFKARMESWRAEFPAERWDQLRVVVLGGHQARDQYALKQFFQWLLREPGYEQRVVYAESQVLPSGENKAPAVKRGFELLTKVDFELEAAEAVFGEAALLQHDVMGPAAEQIIDGWGKSTWP